MADGEHTFGHWVESNVRHPREGEHYQLAMRCISLPNLEEENVQAMARLQSRYKQLCQKHFGRGPHRQSFGRWLMERGLYYQDACVLPALGASVPVISPCMRRELREILRRPPLRSPLPAYKTYLQQVEVQLAKRPNRVKSISSIDAGILLNRMPACLKLIDNVSGLSSESLRMTQEDCDKVIDVVEPLVERLILSDVDEICTEMSQYADRMSREIAAKRSADTAASMEREGVPADDRIPSTERQQPAAAGCSPALTWNDFVCKGQLVNGAPLAVASNGINGMAGVCVAGQSRMCGKHVAIHVPAGRGWRGGARQADRQRIIKQLKAATAGPCDNCIRHLPPVPLVPCQVRDSANGKLKTVSSDGLESSISLNHFNKLRRLYEMTCSKFDPELKYFPQRLLSMLKRYEALFGDMSAINLQGALPLDMHECLHTQLGVTMECFASPLNCYFPQYCSMFPDTDTAFGSRGSFYSFAPVEGSMSVNPPFCEEVFVKVVDQIEGLLAASALPLSFCIIVPEWRHPPTPGAVKLDRSRFLRKHIVVGANKHKYRSGSQHTVTSASNMEFVANFGTEVFFVQNDAGASKWPVSESFIRALCKSFGDS